MKPRQQTTQERVEVYLLNACEFCVAVALVGGLIAACVVAVRAIL